MNAGLPTAKRTLLPLHQGSYRYTITAQLSVVKPLPSGGSRKFWWGGFEAQNLKNSVVFTKIESDFSAEIGNSNVFFAQIQVVSKKKKKKEGFHQN